jgi:hypothetical protein
MTLLNFENKVTKLNISFVQSEMLRNVLSAYHIYEAQTILNLKWSLE